MPYEHVECVSKFKICSQGSRSPLDFFMELEELMITARVKNTPSHICTQFLAGLNSSFKTYLETLIRMGQPRDDVDALVRLARKYHYKLQRREESLANSSQLRYNSNPFVNYFDTNSLVQNLGVFNSPKTRLKPKEERVVAPSS